jgi:hypothetical protein
LAAEADESLFLSDRDVFGRLGEDSRFVSEFLTARSILRERGPRTLVESLAE